MFTNKEYDEDSAVSIFNRKYKLNLDNIEKVRWVLAQLKNDDKVIIRHDPFNKWTAILDISYEDGKLALWLERALPGYKEAVELLIASGKCKQLNHDDK